MDKFGEGTLCGGSCVGLPVIEAQVRKKRGEGRKSGGGIRRGFQSLDGLERSITKKGYHVVNFDNVIREVTWLNFHNVHTLHNEAFQLLRITRKILGRIGLRVLRSIRPRFGARDGNVD